MFHDQRLGSNWAFSILVPVGSDDVGHGAVAAAATIIE